MINVNKSFFDSSIALDRLMLYGQFTDREKDFLYHFVQELKPSSVVEFSSCCGYVTSIIASALRDSNVVSESFDTYEIDLQCYNHTCNNLWMQDFDSVNVVCGDVMKTMNTDSLKRCKFLFVDSDHSKEFAESYVNKFFSLLSNDCYVAVHDIYCSEETNPESLVILNYLKKNNIHEVYYVPEILAQLGIPDDSKNVLRTDKIIERSSLLIFRNHGA